MNPAEAKTHFRIIAMNFLGPDLAGNRLYLDAGDRSVELLMRMRDPLVLLLGSVLTESECDALVGLALPRMQRSLVIQTDTGDIGVSDLRTGNGMSFKKAENPLVERIEARISSLLRWPSSHFEGLQVSHYPSGAEYRPHYDFFDPEDPGTSVLINRGGQRIGTLIMYLAEPEAGGFTSFPDLGLEITPHKGHALFFAYEQPSEATRTLHAGDSVLAGNKWIATKWVRECAYEKPTVDLHNLAVRI